MDSNERSVHLITLKLTDKEYMKIRDNIKAVHEKMSTARYVTVMAMYGYYVQVDFSELQALTALFRKICPSIFSPTMGTKRDPGQTVLESVVSWFSGRSFPLYSSFPSVQESTSERCRSFIQFLPVRSFFLPPRGSGGNP